MRMTRVFAMLGAIAALTLLGARTDAQLQKRGAFSGIVGYHFENMSQVVQVDNDQWIWGGRYQGLFRSDTGEGFLHRTSVVCTALGQLKKGSMIHNSGDCAATDKDGDKAVWNWKCTACPGQGWAGDFQYTGGTGKYAGLKGGGTYQETNVLGTGNGWLALKGEWELP